MEGKWILYNTYFNQTIGYEFFENGKFVKGHSGADTYIDYQRILIDGFCANEDLYLDVNNLGCPGDRGIFFLEYENNSLNDSYYTKLIDTLTASLGQSVRN